MKPTILRWVGPVATLAFLLALPVRSPAQSVSATAGQPSPQPAVLSESISTSLSASDSNPPPSPYGYPPNVYNVNPPTWSWTILTVEWQPTLSDPWGPSPGGDSTSINQPDSSVPDATLTGSFTYAGYWRVTAQVQVNYNDSPGPDTWTGTATVQVVMTVVQVLFQPSCFAVAANQSDSLGVVILPVDIGPLAPTYTLSPPDLGIVTGAAPTLTITGGGNVETGTITATLGPGRVCGTGTIEVVSGFCPGQ